MEPGIDVSFYQRVIAWIQTASDPDVKFAFIRAGQGLTTDPLYIANAKGAFENSVIWAPYWVVEPKFGTGTAQGQAFMKAVADAGYKRSMPLVLDLERLPGITYDYYVTNHLQWWQVVFDCKRVIESMTGEPPIIYTSAGFCNGLYPPAWLESLLLWVANYDAKTPWIPIPWGNWLFWQYSNKGDAQGIVGFVDQNWFNGTKDQLMEFARNRKLPYDGGGVTPQLPHDGVITATRNLRSSAKVANNVVGSISPGAVVTILETTVESTRIWGRITGTIWVCIKDGKYVYINWK